LGHSNPLVVLVVEDEALIADIVGDALTEAGFSVVTVASPKDAFAALDSPDSEIVALVTDINLGMKETGWDVARHARELNPHVAVVFMSGGSAHQWTTNGVPLSVMVTKPFAPVQVVTAVASLLNGPDGHSPL
jgi:DNA-binding response OmpR family regulator